MTDSAIDERTQKIININDICSKGNVIKEYRKHTYLCTVCNAPLRPYSKSKPGCNQDHDPHFKHTGSKSKDIAECDGSSFLPAFRSTIKHIASRKKQMSIRTTNKMIKIRDLGVLENHKRFDIIATYKEKPIYIRLSYHPNRPLLTNININNESIIEININEDFVKQMRLKHPNTLPFGIYHQLISESCSRRISEKLKNPPFK